MRVFVIYVFLCGLAYFLSDIISQYGISNGACENLAMGRALLLETPSDK